MANHNNDIQADVLGAKKVYTECELPNKQSLLDHEKQGQGVKKTKKRCCTICKKDFSSRYSYKLHFRGHTGERPYSCQYCPKRFCDGSSLQKHERVHTGEKPFVCLICPKKCNQKVSLRKHISSQHVPSQTESEMNKNCLECVLCKNILHSRDDLIDHLLVHSDVKRSLEWTKTNRESLLKKRMSMTPGITDQNEFFETSLLASDTNVIPKGQNKRHMSNQNERNQADMLCTECGLKFTGAQLLFDHQQQVHKVECGKSFDTRNSYQIDVGVQTEGQHGCEVCTKRFCDRSTLKKHERVHTGEKPFTCLICSKSFSQRASLRRHIYLKHVKIKISEGCFKCDICGIILQSSKDLIDHLLQHSDRKTQPKCIPNKNHKRLDEKKLSTTSGFTKGDDLIKTSPASDIKDKLKRQNKRDIRGKTKAARLLHNTPHASENGVSRPEDSELRLSSSHEMPPPILNSKEPQIDDLNNNAIGETNIANDVKLTPEAKTSENKDCVFGFNIAQKPELLPSKNTFNCINDVPNNEEFMPEIETSENEECFFGFDVAQKTDLLPSKNISNDNNDVPNNEEFMPEIETSENEECFFGFDVAQKTDLLSSKNISNDNNDVPNNEEFMPEIETSENEECLFGVDVAQKTDLLPSKNISNDNNDVPNNEEFMPEIETSENEECLFRVDIAQKTDLLPSKNISNDNKDVPNNEEFMPEIETSENEECLFGVDAAQKAELPHKNIFNDINDVPNNEDFMPEIETSENEECLFGFDAAQKAELPHKNIFNDINDVPNNEDFMSEIETSENEECFFGSDVAQKAELLPRKNIFNDINDVPNNEEFMPEIETSENEECSFKFDIAQNTELSSFIDIFSDASGEQIEPLVNNDIGGKFTLCDTTLENIESSFRLDIADTTELLSCKECSEIFNSRLDLLTHSQIHL